MLRGIGVDLCKISRMAKCIENKHFVERVFSDEEILYSLAKPDPARHFASAFAMREAFSKASGLSLSGLVFKGISVIRTDTGPRICFDNLRMDLKEKLGSFRAHLSISHDGDNAVAFVVLEEGSCYE